MKWRTGRKVGRTIYEQVGEEPSDEDRLIGMMDTPELADEAAAAHNRVFGYRQALGAVTVPLGIEPPEATVARLRGRYHLDMDSGLRGER